MRDCAAVHGKTVLIVGGTGSLGTRLIERLLAQPNRPARIDILSRDEAKQLALRERLLSLGPSTEEVQYQHLDMRGATGSLTRIRFHVGDARDKSRAWEVVFRAQPDIVIYAAAIKQVPVAEASPMEAVNTNVLGWHNILTSSSSWRQGNGVKVLYVSTDKVAAAVTAYGATKLIGERLAVANGAMAVRYGNVMGSRGSVLPKWKALRAEGKPLPLTDPKMTRYMMTLDDAVDCVFVALDKGIGGDVVIPEVPSARMADVARLMAGDQVQVTGIRLGEKLHEYLVSKDELPRLAAFTTEGGREYWKLRPEMQSMVRPSPLCSDDNPMDDTALVELLSAGGWL